jgi:hypothetical protein
VLRVSTGPKVLSQSGAVTVCDGDTAKLSVTTEDTTGVSYQWWFKGAPINGATSASLERIGSVTTEGSYWCVVSTPCGSDTAKQCSIARNAVTTITVQPRKETKLLEGGTIVLTVEATGKNLKYIWYVNGKALPNDTTATLTIRDAKASNAGGYRVRILGDCGAAESDSALVLVTSDVRELAEFGFTMDVPTPNPAQDQATVSFELTAPKAVVLSVMDILGRNVLTPVQGIIEAGRHSVALDCSSLSGGTYTIRLQSGDTVLSRTFVVVK